MTTPTYSALRDYDRCVAGLLADDQVDGDLLLVALFLARAVHLADPPLPLQLGTIDQALFPVSRPVTFKVVGSGQTEVGDGAPARLKTVRGSKASAVLHADIRRYRAPLERYGPCDAPMVRRRGRCGNTSGGHLAWVTDPLTGERSQLHACTRREHQAWLARTCENNRAELAASPAPVPAANSGGLLVKHLDDIDWPGLWRHLDSKWTPPPEQEPFRRPRFQLLVDEDAELSEAARPDLDVIEGGWR